MGDDERRTALRKSKSIRHLIGDTVGVVASLGEEKVIIAHELGAKLYFKVCDSL
jgi:hypothetical protein